jgi:diacylglycerol kinase (ATP)
VSSVAVIAHSGKSIGGGLLELRRTLERHGVTDLFWCEVSKSKKAPKHVRLALDQGAELIFVWGGDGIVQQCVNEIAGTDATLAIIPAGTANLLATDLGIPKSIEDAVEIGLNGDRRQIDLGRLNGERFAAVAGAGFDAALIRDANGSLKEHFGRLSYVWAGSKNIRTKPFKARIAVDGATWYDGKATSIMFGNIRDAFGGVEAIEEARPDDGMIELGVVSAEGLLQWARTIARAAVGSAPKSPFVQVARAHRVKVKLNRKVLYELDGGDRTKLKKFDVEVEPGAISVRVPSVS